MRDTVAWSDDLLPTEDQVLFRRLSVFVGGFGLPAAAAVAGAAAFERLSVLLENSLVRPNVPPSDGDGSEPRFTMLETVRAYGLERLEASGEGEEIRGRYANYYVALAERATAGSQAAGRSRGWSASNASTTISGRRSRGCWSADGRNRPRG